MVSLVARLLHALKTLVFLTVLGAPVCAYAQNLSLVEIREDWQAREVEEGRKNLELLVAFGTGFPLGIAAGTASGLVMAASFPAGTGHRPFAFVLGASGGLVPAIVYSVTYGIRVSKWMVSRMSDEQVIRLSRAIFRPPSSLEAAHQLLSKLQSEIDWLESEYLAAALYGKGQYRDQRYFIDIQLDRRRYLDSARIALSRLRLFILVNDAYSLTGEMRDLMAQVHDLDQRFEEVRSGFSELSCERQVAELAEASKT